MNSGPLQDWLDRLGYVEGRGTLHRAGGQYEASHPYAPELEELLAPEGSIRASAVLDVEGYPTVAFFDAVGKPFDEATLLAARQRIWNQNLISVVMVATEDELRILPASLKVAKMARLTKDHASQHSEYSAADVASGHLQRHQPDLSDCSQLACSQPRHLRRQVLIGLGTSHVGKALRRRVPVARPAIGVR